MSRDQRQRRRRGGAALLATLLLALGAGPTAADAAGPPTIGEVWVSAVFSGSARINAQINPNGLATSFHIDYIPKGAYEANLGASKDPFAGTSRIPPSTDANIGAGNAPVTVFQQPGLSPDTAYRYRVVAKNSTATTISSTFDFATQIVPSGKDTCANASVREAQDVSFLLADCRAWEMVSPIDKNGGEAELPGALADGGALQAAAGGGAVTYGSAASFGVGAQGAAPASQYLATRVSGGWSTQNVTPSLYSASYNSATEGVPFQLFSGDLTRALLLNGRHCRAEGSDCAVPNPPLAGTDAPAGYQNYYLREGGGYTALLGAANVGQLALEPRDFELRLTGTSPDLRQVVVSTCAALTLNATEVPLGEGCDPAQQNLYRYSSGAGLTLVNLLPAQSTGTPGATLGAQSGAISADGSRIYFTQGGSLYLREGSLTKQVDEAAGGGGRFETASADGSVAYFTKGGHLWRYLAAGAGSSSDLTPSGNVAGVLGSSEDGAYVYYLATGLFSWHAGTATQIAASAEVSNYPPATGTSRVSADGTKLLFLATASLTGYDNKDLNNPAVLDSQVYLYDVAKGLTCVSCNPTFERPIGPSTIPGAISNGSAPDSTQIYKPRALAANGRRVFFESLDAIGPADTNGEQDVYQWEAQGIGSCTRPGGCVALISSGKAAGGASFLDAAADGDDAFVLTDGPLLKADPGAVDVYDARVGGGLPVPSPPLVCFGDACQPLPSEPVDPTLTTLLSGPGNPAVRYPKSTKHCKKSYVRRKGKCVKKKAKKAGKAHKRGRGR